MATYWENSCSFGLRYVSWYKYLIVSLVFSHLGFWSGNLFLIAPFPDLCLLVPFGYLFFFPISIILSWKPVDSAKNCEYSAQLRLETQLLPLNGRTRYGYTYTQNSSPIYWGVNLTNYVELLLLMSVWLDCCLSFQEMLNWWRYLVISGI